MRPTTVRQVFAALALTLTVVLLGCTATETGAESGSETPAVTTATPTTAESTWTATATASATETPEETASAQADLQAEPEAPLYDPTLTREDVDCSRDFVSSGGGEEFPEAFTSAHYVVDGVLGAVCLGEEDPRLIEAWEWLRIVAPAEDLDELILFAGFDTVNDLLAYVEGLTGTETGVAFQMTVNLREAEADPVELALTMAHEFAHVFTGVVEQLDRSVDMDLCPTYHDGDGCYRDGSYVALWVDAFWDDWIAEIDPLNPDDGAAVGRCVVDESFLGSYAATGPSEDFAESFSAYVYSVPVDSPELQAKYEFFDSIPQLAKYQDRIEAFGFDSLPNQFEGCGA